MKKYTHEIKLNALLDVIEKGKSKITILTSSFAYVISIILYRPLNLQNIIGAAINSYNISRFNHNK